MITIDWGNAIINVPKADMTLIQSSPTEIRELNINTFRLALKDLEDSEEGIVYPRTHDHNPSVTVGGVQLAKVVQILDPYTVTFENGTYAVNLVGANSNIADKTNVNSVSVRSANSAGLIQTREIEHSSFNGGVTIDVTSPYSGEAYPHGTQREPVNNLADALAIAELRGFTQFFVVEDLTIGAGDPYVGYSFIGESTSKSVITVNGAANVADCEFYNATIQGTLDGNCVIKNCQILDLTYIEGQIESCLLGSGTIELAGNAYIIDCWSGELSGALPAIDMGGTGATLNMRNYNGGINIVNKSGSESVSLDLNAGKVTLDSTVTAGTIIIRGVGELEDNSTGITAVNSEFLINPEMVAGSVYNASPALYDAPGTFGELFSGLDVDVGFLLKCLKNKKSLVKELGVWYLIIYDDDELTEIVRKPLKDKNGGNINDVQVGVLAQELETIV